MNLATLLQARYDAQAPDSTAEPARWTAVIDQMLAHRSVRRHKPEPVTDAQLSALVAAAQSAAS